VLSIWRTRLCTGAGALAVGGFLILWLPIWPFWRVLNHYIPAPSKTAANPR
jgi:hypothetical protein